MPGLSSSQAVTAGNLPDGHSTPVILAAASQRPSIFDCWRARSGTGRCAGGPTSSKNGPKYSPPLAEGSVAAIRVGRLPAWAEWENPGILPEASTALNPAEPIVGPVTCRLVRANPG